MLTNEDKILILYKIFEEQGFVVGDGIGYGVDLLLYTDQKSKVHSKYAVLLKREQNFHQLIAISRLCITVKKELVLVDVKKKDIIFMYKISRFEEASIVGPNGSGKSNIVCALEFVLNSRSVLCSQYISNIFYKRLQFLKEKFDDSITDNIAIEGGLNRALEMQNTDNIEDNNAENTFISKKVSDNDIGLESINQNENIIGFIGSTSKSSDDQQSQPNNLEFQATKDNTPMKLTKSFELLDTNMPEPDWKYFDTIFKDKNLYRKLDDVIYTCKPQICVIVESHSLLESLKQYDGDFIPEILDYMKENFSTILKETKNDKNLHSIINARIKTRGNEFFTSKYKNTVQKNLSGNTVHNNLQSFLQQSEKALVFENNKYLGSHGSSSYENGRDAALSELPGSDNTQSGLKAGDFFDLSNAAHINAIRKYIEARIQQECPQTFDFDFDFTINSIKNLISLHRFVILERIGSFFHLNGICFPQFRFAVILVLLSIDTALFPLLNPSSYNSKSYKSLMLEDLNIDSNKQENVPAGDDHRSGTVLQNIQNSHNVDFGAPDSFEFRKLDSHGLNNSKTQSAVYEDTLRPQDTSPDQNFTTSSRSDFIPQLNLMTTKHVSSLIQNISLSTLLTKKTKILDTQCKKITKEIKNLVEKRRRIVLIEKEIKEHRDIVKRHKSLLSKLMYHKSMYYLSKIYDEYSVAKSICNQVKELKQSANNFVCSFYECYFQTIYAQNILSIFVRRNNLKIFEKNISSNYMPDNIQECNLKPLLISDLVTKLEPNGDVFIFLKRLCRKYIDFLKTSIFGFQNNILNIEQQIAEKKSEVDSLNSEIHEIDRSLQVFKQNIEGLIKIKTKIETNYEKIRTAFREKYEAIEIRQISAKSDNLSLYNILRQKGAGKNIYDSKKPKNSLDSAMFNENRLISKEVDSKSISGLETKDSLDSNTTNCFCCNGVYSPTHDVLDLHKTTFMSQTLQDLFLNLFDSCKNELRDDFDQLENLQNGALPLIERNTLLRKQIVEYDQIIKNFKEKTNDGKLEKIYEDIRQLESSIMAVFNLEKMYSDQDFYPNTVGTFVQGLPKNDENTLLNPQTHDILETLSIRTKNKDVIISAVAYARNCSSMYFLKTIFSDIINSLLFLKQVRKATKKSMSDLDVISYLRSKFDLHGRIADLFTIHQDRYTLPLSVLIPNENLIISKSESSIFDSIEYLKETKKGKFAFLPLSNLKTKFSYPDLAFYLERFKETKKSGLKFGDKHSTFHQEHRSSESNKTPNTYDRSFTSKTRSEKGETEFICYAIDTITCENSVKKAFEYVLENSIIVGTFEFARYLKYEVKHQAKIATLDGTLIHKNGFITGGRADNKFSQKDKFIGNSCQEFIENYEYMVNYYAKSISKYTLNDIKTPNGVEKNFKNDLEFASSTTKPQNSEKSPDLFQKNFIFENTRPFCEEKPLDKPFLEKICLEIDAVFKKYSNLSSRNFLEKILTSSFFQKRQQLFSLFYILQKYPSSILDIAENVIDQVILCENNSVCRNLFVVSIIINSSSIIIKGLSTKIFSLILDYNKPDKKKDEAMIEQLLSNKYKFYEFLENIRTPNNFLDVNALCILPSSNPENLITNLIVLKQKISDLINTNKARNEIYSEIDSKISQSLEILSQITQKHKEIQSLQSVRLSNQEKTTFYENQKLDVESQSSKLLSSISKAKFQINEVRKNISNKMTRLLQNILIKYHLTLCQAEFIQAHIKNFKEAANKQDYQFQQYIQGIHERIQLYAAENQIYAAQIKKYLANTFILYHRNEIPLEDLQRGNEFFLLNKSMENSFDDNSRKTNLLEEFELDYQNILYNPDSFTVLPFFLRNSSTLQEIKDALSSIESTFYILLKFVSLLDINMTIISDACSDSFETFRLPEFNEGTISDTELLKIADDIETVFKKNISLRAGINTKVIDDLIVELNNIKQEFRAENQDFIEIKTKLDTGLSQMDNFSNEIAQNGAMFTVNISNIIEILNEVKQKCLKMPFISDEIISADFQNVENLDPNALNRDFGNDDEKITLQSFNITQNDTIKTVLDSIHGQVQQTYQIDSFEENPVFFFFKKFFDQYNLEILTADAHKQELETINAELEHIVVKEPSQKKSNIEKMDHELSRVKNKLKLAQKDLNKYRTIMNIRFFNVFNLLNSYVSEIYKFIYETDQVNVKLILDTSISGTLQNLSITNELEPFSYHNLPTPNRETTNHTESLGSPFSNMPLRFNHHEQTPIHDDFILKIHPFLDKPNEKSDFCDEIDFDSLQIYAMPPNKRFTLINNLSGGEQTMVNVAILLAVSRIKKLPFTFFDEIDSCLDVENAKRLLQFLQKKRSSVIISHRPSVVAMCDALVGVYKTNKSHILTYRLDQ